MSTDLLAMRTFGLAGDGRVTLNLFDAPAQVEGIQTLVQRFLTLILREYDDLTGLGTTLISSLTNGRIVNDAFLISLVGQSVLAVQNQIPDVGASDERLSSVKILAARKRADGAFIQFEITSQAGTTAVFALPRVL